MMTTRFILLLLFVLLSGCATNTAHRELDVQGSLPNAVTVGAFAPSCFLFCFVSNRATQGNLTDSNDVDPPFAVREKRHVETTISPLKGP